MLPAPSTLRRTAAATLVAAAALSASACSAVNYQATTNVYSGSDGVRTDIGEVELRHIALVGSDEGGPARLLGLINNDGTETADVELDISGTSFSFTLDSGEAVNLQNDEELIVDSIDAAPGALQDVTATVDGTEEIFGATVLDGAIAAYRDYLPEGFDPETVEHLEHGPDTYGGGAAHHGPGEEGH